MSDHPFESGDVSTEERISASAVRAFYSFAIDLSDFDGVSSESLTKLQETRSNGGLHTVFLAEFKGVEGYAWTAPKIDDDGAKASNIGGKRVWSETFRNRARWKIPAGGSEFDFDRTTLRCGQAISISSLTDWTLDEVNQFITGDGVLILTCSFRTETAIEIDALIDVLSDLKKAASQIFDQALKSVLAPESHLAAALSKIGFEVSSQSKSEKIREHRTIFVKSLIGSDGSVRVPHEMNTSAAIAGILNLADWYREYHDDYRAALSKKEVGYKRSELYLTDRTATLVIQDGFWERNNPLFFYLGDVMLAVEYHLGIQALLRGQLQYARAMYSASRAPQAAGVDAVDDVRRMRAILSGAYESLNYSVLVLHGFTRLLLVGLDRESEIGTLLSDVERRVENVSDSVGLRASVESSNAAAALQGFGNVINARVLKATYAAVFLALASLVISVLAFVNSG